MVNNTMTEETREQLKWENDFQEIPQCEGCRGE